MRRGKRVAITCAIAAVLALGASGFAAKRLILEQWYLYRLESSDLGAKKIAIEKLGELKSSKAVPRLLEVVRSDDSLGPTAAVALVRIGESTVPGLLDALHEKGGSYRRRTAVAVSEVAAEAKAAVPFLLSIALRGGKAGGNESAMRQAVDGLEKSSFDFVPFLVAALRDQDANISSCAMQAIEWVGPRAEPAIPALVSLLGVEGYNQGSQAAGCLGHIGVTALPALIGALKHSTVRARENAAFGLERMGPHAAEAGSALVEALKDPEKTVRAMSARALGAIGPAAVAAVPALIGAMNDPNLVERERFEGDVRIYFGDQECVEPRNEAALALGKIGAGSSEVVSALIEALHGENRCLRVCAAQGLAALGSTARAAIPDLAYAVEKWGADTRVARPFGATDRREAALEAIGQVGADSEDALRAVMFALASDSEGLRQKAFGILSRLGEKAAPAIPALIDALDLPDDGSDYSQAAVVLGKIGAQAIPHLVLALASDKTRVRRGAACAFYSLGSQAREAIPALLPLLEAQDDGERWAAASVLSHICPAGDPRLLKLIPRLRDASAAVRSAAVLGCAQAGPKAFEALPSLREILQDEQDTARKNVPDAVAAIAGGTNEAIELLLGSLKDKDVWVRISAAHGLKRVKASGPQVEAALLAALREAGAPSQDSEYFRVRISAAYTLLQMGSSGTRAVLECLQHSDPQVRRMAGATIGEHSQASSEAISALKTLLQDPDERVANEARSALRNLGL